jgi:hypothetical protein
MQGCHAFKLNNMVSRMPAVVGGGGGGLHVGFGLSWGNLIETAFLFG